MAYVKKFDVQPTFKGLVFYTFLWCLLLLNSFTLGCSNHHDAIQAVVSREHAPLIAPMPKARNQPDKPLKKIYKKQIRLKAKQSQLNILPSLAGATLLLGNSHIEHWPLGLPNCKQCNLVVKRDFHPDGPTTRLVLTSNDKDYLWGVVESSQKNTYVLAARLYFNGQGELNMLQNNADKNTKTVLQTGLTYQFKNCTLTPLWIENIKSLSAAYSDDQAKHKIQIFFECH